MRKLFIGVMLTFFLSFPVARITMGQDQNAFRAERKNLNERQKRERKVMNAQQKVQKRSWRNGHITKASRAQAKHQMQQDKRALHLQQKKDRQDLKDRERLVRERTKQVR